MKSYSNTRPETVLIEKSFNGKLYARLTENVSETSEIDENGNTITRFDYDEYVYETAWSRDTEAQVRANPKKFLAIAKIKTYNPSE